MSVDEKALQTQTKEIAQLGDGEVFIRRTPNGVLKSVRGAVTLTEGKGHIADIGGNKLMFTQEAYEEANKIAGVSIITPAKLTLPSGEKVVNPYPIIDPESGTIAKVWVKKLAVGYSPIGNMVITSATLLYDTLAYFIQDLAKKIKANKDAGRVCMRSQLSAEELAKGIFHALQGELGVWADYTHPEVLKALDTFIQNKLFAERKAQTICERLVYSKHPALVLGKPTAKNMKIYITGYCHSHNADELIEMGERAAEAAPGDETTGINGVEVIDVSGQATDDDMNVGSAADGDDSPSDFPRW